MVPPVAAETTKNPGWSVADEDFPHGLKRDQQATGKEGIGSRTGKGGGGGLEKSQVRIGPIEY